MQSPHATPLETLELRTANLKDENKKVFYLKTKQNKKLQLKTAFSLTLLGECHRLGGYSAGIPDPDG